MKDVNHLEIEKYFAKELTAQEEIDFQNRLTTDKEFSKEVSLYKEINTVLENRIDKKEQNNLRNTLKVISTKSIKKEPKVFSIYHFSKYLVAASVLIFATIFYLNSGSRPNYNDFSKHETIDLISRGNTDSSITKAQNAFNEKNYKKAEKEFRSALFIQPKNTELKIYLAISLMEQNKFDETQNVLDPIVKGNSIFKNKAIWYLGLSKLKQKDYKACKSILSTLTKDSEDYQNAQKIIKNL